MSVKYTHSKGNTALMNTMYNMSLFIVIVPVSDESSSTLTDYFFQHVLLKFGLCYPVVLDDGNSFKCAFVFMCKALKLNYDILAIRNHKGILVEHFHRFLNKTTTITMEDRQSNDVFIPTGIAAGYAWNSAPIDGTDISRSTVAIGQEFRFPNDIDLSSLSQLTHNNAQSAVVFLRLTNSNRRLFSSILKILIEDRGEANAERVNNNKNIVELVVGGIVMVRTTA